MVSNNQSSLGCGQCDADIRQAPLREFTSHNEFRRFTDNVDDTRENVIAMLADSIFYTRLKSSRADLWNNLAGIIVYEGAPPRSKQDISTEVDKVGEFDQDYDFSIAPDEPNLLYNFYNKTYSASCDGERPSRNSMSSKCKLESFIPYNIFRVNSSIADEIRQWSARFPESTIQETEQQNEERRFSPRYRLQSVGRMWACATDSPTPSATSSKATALPLTSMKCLEDRTCLPIGGHSVWSALGRMNNTLPPKDRKFLFITVPMDSFALFPELAQGAAAEIASLAVMMAVAETVSKYWKGPGRNKPPLRQPVYFAFQAQTWGYAGSSRFLKDVLNFDCKSKRDITKFLMGCKNPSMPSLKFLDFRDADIAVLNIDQLISPRQPSPKDSFKFFQHVSGRSGNEIQLAMERAFKRQAEGKNGTKNPASPLTLGVGGIYDKSFLLPINAGQSFRYFFNKTEQKVDMLSISNYQLDFSTKTYHSIFDSRRRISVESRLRRPMYEAASAIASAIIDLTFNNKTVVKVSEKTIDGIIQCMTGNWSDCGLAREYLGKRYEFYNESVMEGNYPGSFFPTSIYARSHKSGMAKLDFIREFLSYQNFYEDLSKECAKPQDCQSSINALNKRNSPKAQSDIIAGSCTRKKCVASDTYTHNAFGSAFQSNNNFGGSFEFDPDLPSQKNYGQNPSQGDWTESIWDPELGVCGFIEDTMFFQHIIFWTGIAITILSFGLSYEFDRRLFTDKPRSQEQAEAANTGESLVPGV